MQNKNLTVIVCAPGTAKKATKNVPPPREIVMTDNPAAVAGKVVNFRPSTVRFFQTSTRMTNRYSEEIRGKMNGSSPVLEAVLNPHEKSSNQKVCRFVKVVSAL